MRKLGLVTALGVVLGAAFHGVLATRAPIFQQDEAPQVPSAGLVDIPGAQVTAGQLVALPGAEAETSGMIMTLSSSSATKPIGSIQSYHIVSSAAPSFGVIANSSASTLLALPSSSASIQYFHTISAGAGAVVTATSPMFANKSTSALVASTTRAPVIIASTTLGGFSNGTATTAAATIIVVSPGSESAGLIALPTGGSVATGNTETLLSDTLVNSSSSGGGSSSSNATAIEVPPSGATGGLREIPGVQTTPGSLVLVSSGVASPTAVATAGGASVNSTLPSFGFSAATTLSVDTIMTVLVMGVVGIFTTLCM